MLPRELALKLIGLLRYEENPIRDRRIIDIIKSSGFELDVCQAGASLLTRQEIIEIMKGGKGDEDICEVCLKFLNLKKMSEQDLLDLLRNNAYCGYLFQQIAPYLNKDNCLKVMKESGYKKGVCQVTKEKLEHEFSS